MSEFAGTLTQRIEVWRRRDDRVAGGTGDEEWERVERCLAAIEAEGVGSSTEAMTLSAMPRYRVTVRSGLPLLIDSQVRWKGKRLTVRQLMVDPARPDRIVSRCEELR